MKISVQKENLSDVTVLVPHVQVTRKQCTTYFKNRIILCIICSNALQKRLFRRIEGFHKLC